MTEIRPVTGADDLDAWVETHNRVAPVPYTVAEIEAYREALAGSELHLLALAGATAVGVGFVAVEAGAADAWIGLLPESRHRGIGGHSTRASRAGAAPQGWTGSAAVSTAPRRKAWRGRNAAASRRSAGRPSSPSTCEVWRRRTRHLPRASRS